MDIPRTQRQKLLARYSALKDERSTWIPAWKDIADYILPYRSRFQSTEVNKGTRRNHKIINNEAQRAHRVMSSGMMEGISSPARPWFRLGTFDPGFDTYHPAQQYFATVEQVMREVMARSNIYNCLHIAYKDIGAFGTGTIHIEKDVADGIRGFVFPIGQYALATDAAYRVDTIYREVYLTVGQTVERFGLDACSKQVQLQYQRGNYDQRVDVLHVIEPNRGFMGGLAAKKYRSVWVELKADEHAGVLRESGFHDFPTMVPRWEVLGEDAYGIGPGFDVVGDAMAVQVYERDKADLVKKLGKPPLAGPSSLVNRRVSLVPGDLTPVDYAGVGQKLEPILQVTPPAILAVEASIREHERRIATGFFADLWLMINMADGTEKTAKEIAVRQEEKLLQLGPVSGRLQNELLKPLIARVFALLDEQGYFPPPPPELAGQDIKVEFISTLTQAQKLIGALTIERAISFIGQIQPIAPNVVDNIDFDATARSYIEAIGTTPVIVKDERQVEEERRARAEAQMQREQLEMMGEAAKAGKTLSETNTQGDNALTQLMGMMRGGGMA